MSDIVERLRTKHVYGAFEIEQQRQDASDEIERLNEWNRLRAEDIMTLGAEVGRLTQLLEKAERERDALRLKTEQACLLLERAFTNAKLPPKLEYDISTFLQARPGGKS